MKWLLCILFGHKYRLHRKVTLSIRELKCKRCKSLFAMSDDVYTVLPLSADLKRMHDDLIQSQYQPAANE